MAAAEDKEAKRLTEWLALHNRGEVDREAGAAIRDVARAVLVHDKEGTVTIEIKMKKNGGRLIVGAKVKKKEPEAPVEAGLYFVGEDGLQKDDPLQLVFESMKDPGLTDGPVRDVDTDTGEIRVAYDDGKLNEEDD